MCYVHRKPIHMHITRVLISNFFYLLTQQTKSGETSVENGKKEWKGMRNLHKK